MALPAEEIHREEGFEGRTDDVRFKWETTGDYFEDWQVAHFRLLEDTKKLPYGRCLKYDTYIETSDGVKFIKDIQYLVGNHSLRKGEIENKSIELKILQDSDIISDIGAAGFIRFFSYAGRFKKNIIETIKNLQNNNKNFSDEILNLDISKKIAEKEMKIQKNLTYGLLKEIDSDLL
jgi:hypothetical protein